MRMPRIIYQVYDVMLVTRAYYLYSVCFSLISLLFLSLWFLIYQPMVQRLLYAHHELNNLHIRYDEQMSSEKNIRKLTRSNEQLQKKIVTFANNKSSLKMVDDIVDCALSAGLNVKFCRLCDLRDKGWCAINQCTGEFIASAEQLHIFFGLLQKSKPHIQCKHCRLTRIDDTSVSLHLIFEQRSYKFSEGKKDPSTR
jgi:hypothetical protein